MTFLRNRTSAQQTQNDLASGFDGYFRLVYRYIRTRVPSDQEAEDLASDILLLGWRNARQFTGTPGELAPWLFGIAKNQLKMHWRKRRVTQTDWEAVEHLVSDEGRGQHGLDVSLDLERSLEHLPEEQRNLLLLRYVDGWSYKELAELLGENAQTLRQRASRLLRHVTLRTNNNPYEES